MSSLEIYNELPEDYSGTNVNPCFSFEELISKCVKSIIREGNDYSLSEDIESFGYFYREKNYYDRDKLKNICKFAIFQYRSFLKRQRLGESVSTRAKENCQLLNYYLQNIIDKDSKIPEGKEIIFTALYKPWDAIVDLSKRKFYVVDCSQENNFKMYDFQGILIESHTVKLPTKITSVNDCYFIHSTYSCEFSIYNSSGNINTFRHKSEVVAIYEIENEVFLIDSQWEIYNLSYENSTEMSLMYVRTIESVEFFIDSYCLIDSKLYCCSHTSSKVLIYDIRTSNINFMELEGVYMPNSIESYQDGFVVSDKETGYISVFDNELKLKGSFGKFSKFKMGNADTTVALPISLDEGGLSIASFSWLKDSCSFYRGINL